ncbi:MAG: hypothetical protein A2156_10330 [Deltaproteobacteria bacterium RBG_16_48_10]|nr:MAG: hypothetical protein A2156_10330 [Deltaproteobacteria bacterium RBG_16_48_10]
MNFSCYECGKEYPIETFNFRCECGGPFKLNSLPKSLPLLSLKERPASIWRYRESLPVMDDKNFVTLGEGFTPLVPFPYAEGYRNIKTIYN